MQDIATIQTALTAAATATEIALLAIIALGVWFQPHKATRPAPAPEVAPVEVAPELPAAEPVKSAPCPMATEAVLTIPDLTLLDVGGTEANLAKLPAAELRKICSAHGIQWRNAHGKNRHLTKAEMLAELTA